MHKSFINLLAKDNLSTAHALAVKHLLPARAAGNVRKSNMIILNYKSGEVQYEAANVDIVADEYQQFWTELAVLLRQEMTIKETFFYASFIHLIFVKIHPFEDGNGRIARLLEKWFLVSKLGEKAWMVPSESYYYGHLEEYYTNLQRVGLFYDELNFEKAYPFLGMLVESIQQN